MEPKPDWFFESTTGNLPVWYGKDGPYRPVDAKPETLEERVARLERELQQLRREMREIALPRIYDLESRHPPRKPRWAMPKAPYKAGDGK